jgi:hypothetical protein
LAEALDTPSAPKTPAIATAMTRTDRLRDIVLPLPYAPLSQPYHYTPTSSTERGRSLPSPRTPPGDRPDLLKVQILRLSLSRIILDSFERLELDPSTRAATMSRCVIRIEPSKPLFV